MIIYPAIDIRGGRCVRLTEGRFDAETVFADDPAEMAAKWAACGAEWLHLVDLDGALAGEGSGVAATELAKRMADYGVATIIFTDISRDGMLSGVNAEATAALARACGVPIIASGGVASLDDIRNVKKYEKDGVAGCIIGKAIYTGAVNLPDALKIAAAKEE